MFMLGLLTARVLFPEQLIFVVPPMVYRVGSDAIWRTADMNNGKEPMPLKDLPAYLDSVREHGQGDYVPVVDMGRIVEPRRRWSGSLAFAAAACLLMGVGGMVTYAAASKSITIVADGVDAGAIAEMVKEGGAGVVSVKQDEDRTYKVRVLTLKMNSLLENLRGNRNLERVDADE